MDPTKEQLAARLNPIATSVSTPTAGVFRSTVNDAILYIREGNVLKMFDATSLLTPQEKSHAGSYGAQIAMAKSKLNSQYGFNYDSVPAYNMGDFNQQFISSGGGYTQRSDGGYSINTQQADISSFLSAPKATTTTQTINNTPNTLGSLPPGTPAPASIQPAGGVYSAPAPSALQQFNSEQTPQQRTATYNAAGITEPSSIGSSSLGSFPTPNFSTPPATPQTDYSKILGDANTAMQDTYKLTAQEQDASNQVSRAKELNTALIGEAAFRTEQEKSLAPLNDTRTSLSNRMQILRAEAAALPTQLEQDAQGKGITTTILNRQQTDKLRINAVQSLLTSAQLSGVDGDIANAKDKIEKAVNEKFGTQKAELDAIIKNLELIKNDPAYSLADKKRAAEQLAIQEQKKQLLADAKAEQKEVWDLSVTATNNGADALTVQKIQNAGSKEEALQILSSSGFAQKKVEQTPAGTSIVEVNGRKILINDMTGQTIKDLGSSSAPNVVNPGEDPQLYSGLSSATATAVRSQVNAYKTEPVVQNFAVVQEGRNFANSLANTTQNPADDQALIYALAKALDPGSVVREGEYATAQKYSQSWISAYGKGVEQALAGTGFLSQTARENIKKTIEQKYNASKASYDNLSKEYQNSISGLTGRSDGSKFIKDYTVAGTNPQPSEPQLQAEYQEYLKTQGAQTTTSNTTNLNENPEGFFSSFFKVFGF